MNTCDTCHHWGDKECDEPGYRLCLHRRMEAVPFPILDGACVVNGDPGDPGVIGTGPKFGCIHHEKKS